MIERLKEKGFQVSIDDFGSGFSALYLLKDLPVNTIKIDRDFVRSSANDIRGKKVLRSVITMCKELKMDVVVEGVETKDQVKFMIGCGCSHCHRHKPPGPISDGSRTFHGFSWKRCCVY